MATNMFDRTLFNYDGMYLTYGPDRRFVARFKHRGPFTKAKFMKKLMEMTPAQYFAAYDAGRAPLQILADFDPAWHDAILEKFRKGGK